MSHPYDCDHTKLLCPARENLLAELKHWQELEHEARTETARLRELLSRYEALTDDTPKLEFIPDPNEPWRGTVRAKKEG